MEWTPSVCVPARHRGLTLTELITTLAIIAVLSTVAVPGFADLLAARRIDAAAGRFFAHVSRGRSEAILRGRRVIACPTVDRENCLADGIWHTGWMLFVDRNADREHQPDEPILERADSLEQVTMETSRMRRRIVLYPNGLTRGSNGTYTFCDSNGSAAPLAVIIANSGRARRARVRADGSALDCTEG